MQVRNNPSDGIVDGLHCPFTKQCRVRTIALTVPRAREIRAQLALCSCWVDLGPACIFYSLYNLCRESGRVRGFLDPVRYFAGNIRPLQARNKHLGSRQRGTQLGKVWVRQFERSVKPIAELPHVRLADGEELQTLRPNLIL